ncbi:MAG: type II secretion system major pseudopilin GspG [Kluyvera sp.]|uniref:type II secretion system major pseudopilin GspG n=1 Tax=Kluyvera sp. TaxID=1538228 RepID=UPI003F3E3426
MKKNAKEQRRSRGFTLLEMMVVVMIIGLLAAMVVPNLLRNKDRANQKKALADIVALESALDLYYLDHNRYPTTAEGLNILKAPDNQSEGYLKRIPQDPWGRPYQYLSPGHHGRIDIFSWGEDGKEGGTGAAADIGNWNVGMF